MRPAVTAKMPQKSDVTFGNRLVMPHGLWLYFIIYAMKNYIFKSGLSMWLLALHYLLLYLLTVPSRLQYCSAMEIYLNTH